MQNGDQQKHKLHPSLQRHKACQPAVPLRASLRRYRRCCRCCTSTAWLPCLQGWGVHSSSSRVILESNQAFLCRSSCNHGSLQTVSHPACLALPTKAHRATAAPFCAPPCVCFQLLQPLRRLPVGSLPRRCRLLAEAGCRLAHALPHLLLSRLCCKSCGQQRRRHRRRPLRPPATCAVAATVSAFQQRLAEGGGRQGAAGTGHPGFAASCTGIKTVSDLCDR